MKTLLVNPPIPENFYNREFYLPSGLMYLLGALEQNNDEAKMIDFKTYQKEKDPSYGLYESKLVEIISEYKPDLIGFGSVFSGNFPDVLRLSEVVKKKFPEKMVIAGGIHPTLYHREILENCQSIDGISLAESEDTIKQIAEVINNNSRDFSKISGFSFRNQVGLKENKKVIVNPKKDYIEDIDSIAFPAYHLIDFEDYYVDTSNWHNPKGYSFKTSVPIISSRSCPHRCSFCAMYKVMGPKWRARSPNNIVDELELVNKEYGQNHFSFMDDNFSLSKSRTIEICDEINRRGLDIQFEAPNGLSIKSLDKEVLDSLTSAGLIRTYIAIESGSDYIRNEIMGKKLPRKKIYEIVDLMKSYPQLALNTFFIMGMPEETKETLNETYKMIKEINADKTILMNIVPFPGTAVFEQAKRDNLFVDLDPTDLYKKGDLYFTNYNRFFIKPYKLSLDDLHEFRTKCEGLIAKHK